MDQESWVLPRTILSDGSRRMVLWTVFYLLLRATRGCSILGVGKNYVGEQFVITNYRCIVLGLTR